jgi:cell division protease FtsH
LKQDIPVNNLKVKIITTLEDVRCNRKDDVQAIIAVHESGHAVLSVTLLSTIPNVVYSVSTDTDSQGFVYSRFAWKYISRKELIPRVAMMLGGYVAEELIFGKEHLTSGAASDIKKATEFLSNMYKSNGMGKVPISYSIPIKDENELYHGFEDVENEIKLAIEEAKRLAESTLKKEQRMLLALSDYLCDNRMLRKNEMKQIADETLSSKVNYIENGDHLYYREHLKEKVKSYGGAHKRRNVYENAISLNKEVIT